MTADEIFERAHWPELIAERIPKPSAAMFQDIGACALQIYSEPMCLVTMGVMTAEEARDSTPSAVSRLFDAVLTELRWRHRDQNEKPIGHPHAML